MKTNKIPENELNWFKNKDDLIAIGKLVEKYSSDGRLGFPFSEIINLGDAIKAVMTPVYRKIREYLMDKYGNKKGQEYFVSFVSTFVIKREDSENDLKDEDSLTFDEALEELNKTVKKFNEISKVKV